MTFPAPERFYQSPPDSGNNDGALPKSYDPLWQGYTNLTQAQVAAFKSFPEDLAIHLKFRRWQAEISGTTVGGIPLSTQDRDQLKIAALKQAFDTGALTGTIPFFDAAGNVHVVDAAAATAIYNGVVAFVAQTFKTAAQLDAAVKAASPTITSRAQIDAAYAAIAPNSPSAKGVG